MQPNQPGKASSPRGVHGSKTLTAEAPRGSGEGDGLQGDPRDNEPLRVHLRVYGLVQGVFFRANMQRVARRHGVRGWVRNLPDGSVEAVLEGPRRAVEEVVKWALRGPRRARVEKLVAEVEPYRGEYDDFEIIY